MSGFFLPISFPSFQAAPPYPHMLSINRDDFINVWIVRNRLTKTAVNDKDYARAFGISPEHRKKWREGNHITKVEHVENNDNFIS